MIGIHSIMPPFAYIVKDTLEMSNNVECVALSGECRGNFEIIDDDGYIQETIEFDIFDTRFCQEPLVTYWTAPGPVSSQGNIIVESGRGTF